MFTKRNTKDELLNYIYKLENRNDILKNRNDILGKSKKSYVKSYEYHKKTIKTLRDQLAELKTYADIYEQQRVTIHKLENDNQYLLQENYVHMQGKIRLQDELFERELLLHSMTGYPTVK